GGHMREAISVSGRISGTDKTLSFGTGKLAPQSQGAVVGRIGDTMVLVTANASTGVREGIDFFPLTVDIEERAYAAGKIPGSFFRREGRPTDQAILTCRLIDRPLRPSFAEGYRNETQVVGTILAADQENPHDVVAINAAEGAPKVTEDAIARGLEEAKTWIRESIELQRQLVEKAGVHEPIPFEPQVDYAPEVLDRVRAVGSDRLSKVITITAKAERNHATDEATSAIMAELSGEFPDRER